MIRALLLLILFLSPQGLPAEDEFIVHRPADAVCAIYNVRLNGWMVAVRTADSLVLIDTFPSPGEAGRALPLLRAFSDLPVKHVIFTHHHWDHTLGAQVFPDATIHASGYAVSRLKHTIEDVYRQIRTVNEELPGLEKKLAAAAPGSEEARTLEARIAQYKRIQLNYRNFAPRLPDLLVGEKDSFTSGGVEFIMRTYGPAHTDNDLIISVPSLGLLLPGDLVEHNGLPYIEDGGNAGNWIAALEKIEKDNAGATILIPGHGQITDLSALGQQRRFLVDLVAAIKQGIASGLTLEEAKEKIRLDQYKSFDRYERGFPFLVENFWKALGGPVPEAQ